ncbi:18630_t:CDS:2, partial [Funneliformis geosporum]
YHSDFAQLHPAKIKMFSDYGEATEDKELEAEKAKLEQADEADDRRETEGTEIMKTRLGVIFSTNELNRKSKRVVIIPLTSKKLEKIYNYEVSVVVNNIKGKTLLDQIRTINKTRLLEKKGNLTKAEMNE